MMARCYSKNRMVAISRNFMKNKHIDETEIQNDKEMGRTVDGKKMN